MIPLAPALLAAALFPALPAGPATGTVLASPWRPADGSAELILAAETGGNPAVGGGGTSATGGRDGSGPSTGGSEVPAVPAPSGRPEILLVGPATEVERAATLVQANGGRVLRQAALGHLGLGTLAVDPAGALSLDGLKARLNRAHVAVSADVNALYRTAGGPRLYAGALVGQPQETGCRLRHPVAVGLIDGPADLSDPALRGAHVVTRTVLSEGVAPAGSDHATDLIDLIAAPPGGPGPAGLAPGANMYLAVAVGREGSRDAARVDDIAGAFDWLIGERVPVVNISLAGPANLALGAVIRAASGLGVVIVAAVGNDARGSVAYPAADPNVIGVTAVDALKRRYERANYGDGVAFAAPGVDLYLPGASGFGYRSGTSYASGVVAALVAQEIGRGRATRAAIETDLAARALDLGAPGRDSLFGWGLVQSGGC